MNFCVRCEKEVNRTTMSFFNLDIICTRCRDEEMTHPKFHFAKDIERKELKKGNFDFPGVYVDKTWEEIKEIA